MDRLAEIFGKENVLKDEPMSRHTTFRIGGAADFFVKVQTISQLQEAMRYLKKEQIPFYIVGNGSNLLVRDEGVRGVVLQLGERFSGYEFLHETPGSVAQSGTAVDKNQIVMVRAKAGSLLGRLGKEFAEYSLSGFEFASGIPGTLGGAVYMNAGAYGGEIKDILVRATLMDMDGSLFEFTNQQMQFGYRKSIAAEKNYIVLEADLALHASSTEEVLAKVEECNELAPLHNPANLIGIRACQDLMPNVPMVGVFDTAFHQTMPKVAYLYGLPYEMYVKYGLRRYGFHGTSHKYVARQAAEMMGEHMSDLRFITCHLGNGASIAAIKYGKSIDTSMGYTPLEGLVMGTRSGEIDPAIIPFLMEKENMNAQQIDDYLNRRSGILGISGLSSDFRDLESAANRGDERSQLAIDIFAYKVKKYIGGYVAAMGGVDAIIFTAGLGENSPFMRDKICNGLEYLGTRIDPELNKLRGKQMEISIKRARVKIFVIPTNEELVIARDTLNICRRIIKL